MAAGIFRPGDQDGREVGVVLEPGHVDRVARRGRDDVLAEEAQLGAAARIDGIRVREIRGVDRRRPALPLIGRAQHPDLYRQRRRMGRARE